jgi:FKBP-type peptidyl-prolyl cis-trans isomerase SlyD
VIKKNDVVTLSYTLKNSDGVEIDKVGVDQAMSYLHGAGNIVLGLEEAVEQLNVGDKKDVKVKPEKGYGDIDPQLMLEVARSNFPADMDLEIGMQFSSKMGGKDNVFTVVSIDGDLISVNGNHPLAGQTLHYNIEIIEIRNATEEELSHGHVHDGSHHH